MEIIPALPWWSKTPFVSTPIKQSTKQGVARGASEVTTQNFLHLFPGATELISALSEGFLGPKKKAPNGPVWDKKTSSYRFLPALTTALNKPT